MSKKRVAVVCGGTSGHIFPALTLIKMLDGCGHVPIIITNNSSFIKHFENCKWQVITLLPEERKILDICKSFIKSLKFLMFSDLDIMISFGSYHSVGAMVAARFISIPIYAYEANLIIGSAILFAFKFLGAKLWIANYCVEGIDDINSRVIHSGYLVNPKIMKIKNSYIPSNKTYFTILITCGSLGSAILDKSIHQSIGRLPLHIRKNLLVIQQVKNESEIVKKQEFYREREVKCLISTFFSPIEKYMLTADLIISRAGATTISEIIFLQKKSILIPFANAAKSHQYYNAKYMNDRGMALLVHEKDCSNIDSYISKIINNDPDSDLFFNLSKLKNSFKIFTDDLIVNEIR